MTNHPILLKILPTVILAIFFIAEGSCVPTSNSKNDTEPEGRKSEIEPKFTDKMQMENVALLMNDTRTLSCPVKSASPVVFSWRKNDTLLNETTVNYTLSHVKLSDAGNYTCTGKNDTHSDHTFNVKVYADKNQLPDLIESPQNLTLKPGDVARIACKTYDPSHTEVDWYYWNITNSSLHKPNNISMYKKLDKKNTVDGVLIIENISVYDAGWYACNYTVGAKNSVAVAKLDVKKNIDANDQDSEIDPEDGKAVDSSRKVSYYNVTENSTAPTFINFDNMRKVIFKPDESMVKLKCAAEGNPLPNVTWFKNGVTPPQRLLGTVKYSQWAITLEDLVVEDSGNYTCNVCNDIGCISFAYKVEVVKRFAHKPFILDKQLHNVTALVYTDVKFNCTPLADLEPFIQWYYNNASFGRIDDRNYETGTLKQSTGDSTNNVQTLSLTNVTHEDEGWYTCVFSNSMGKNYTSAYLKVVDEPGVPSCKYYMIALVVFILVVIAVSVILLVYRNNMKLKKFVASEPAVYQMVPQ